MDPFKRKTWRENGMSSHSHVFIQMVNMVYMIKEDKFLIMYNNIFKKYLVLIDLVMEPSYAFDAFACNEHQLERNINKSFLKNKKLNSYWRPEIYTNDL